MRREEFQIHSAVEDVHWWFCGRRHILLTLFQKENINLRSATVLEIGCGTGGNMRFFKPLCNRVVGVDSNPVAIENAQKTTNAELILGDFRDLLTTRNHEFEVILLLDVLEHVVDDASFLSDLAHLMAPGSWLIVTVPAHPFLWSTHDRVLGHQRRYVPKALLELFASTPLHVRFDSPFNAFLFPIIAALRTVRRLFPQKSPTLSDLNLPPPWLNHALRLIFNFEKYWLHLFRIPFGVSHVIIAIKPTK